MDYRKCLIIAPGETAQLYSLDAIELGMTVKNCFTKRNFLQRQRIKSIKNLIRLLVNGIGMTGVMI